MFSKRIEKLSPSLTIAISQKARELKAAGRDILAFSAGEPDFDTPKIIKEEAIKAINEGFTKYTSVAGIPEVLEAIRIKLKRDNNLDYSHDEIIVSNGAKQSLYNIMACLIEEGDEVIIPAPYWVTYPELVKYHDGIPVAINTTEETNFKITPEMLKKAINPNTKMLILTSPSNPTGAVYSKEELSALAEVLKGTDIWVVSDEMYEKLIYEGEFCATASINNDMLQRTITVNGLSKSHAMTGWRFGYLASKNKDLIKAMIKLQSQMTSNINSITQKAAIPALLGKADADVEMMKAEFKKRRDYVYEAFNNIPGLSAAKPQGAFYIYVNHKEVMEESMAFALTLLEDKGVAVVPGIGFGSEGYFRFSFATDLETIKNGIKRIEEFVKGLK
ncbi:aspartate aminotransferase [Nautilia profundicola AmH]|uniref:Aspartate aminotransferase n=1 Tax=Nautilia profundicola (strain ATCC BAA-1463 / DSM 18972 / AmH) TaxID=598659 RepID=B9L9B7_NAUPA|nr:pyridoxal phosphate-dependent aminotransferase [Nautilia profundicola]ACM93473.1 aspartate aminotransferase [Nautilia profundicola AmH]